MEFKKMAAVAAALCAAGCAAMPERIGATYVSPLVYANYDCGQVMAERERIASRVRQVTGDQARQAQNDQIATGIGLVLFWPALFMLAGPDRKAELSDLKGRYEALEQVAVEKRCAVTSPPTDKTDKPKSFS